MRTFTGHGNTEGEARAECVRRAQEFFRGELPLPTRIELIPRSKPGAGTSQIVEIVRWMAVISYCDVRPEGR